MNQQRRREDHDADHFPDPIVQYVLGELLPSERSREHMGCDVTNSNAHRAHCNGGAKYDQVTDLLIKRFFGIEPPRYVTLTATLRLPIVQNDIGPDDARRIDQELRELAFHPERRLPATLDDQSSELLRQKQQWISTPPTIENAKLRCHQIRAVNEALQPLLAEQRQRLVNEREQVALTLRAHAILASREYAFCLFPEAPLRRLMQL